MTSFNEKIFNVVKAMDTATTNPFAGKYVSILGDYISSYPDYDTVGTPTTVLHGFDTVSKKWWAQLITKLGAKLCVNCSCAGMTAARTTDVSAAYKHFGAQLHRKPGTTYTELDGKTTTPTERIDPDIIFVYLGANDYNVSKVELGDYSDDVFKLQIPDELTDEWYADLSKAYQVVLMDIIKSYPNADVYCISPQTMSQYSGGNYPFADNKASTPWSMPEFEELIRKLCIKFATRQISLSHYGIRGDDNFIGGDEDDFLVDKSRLSPEAHTMIAKICYSKMTKFSLTWNTRNEV